jgi:hypothetical protein
VNFTYGDENGDCSGCRFIAEIEYVEFYGSDSKSKELIIEPQGVGQLIIGARSYDIDMYE